MCEPAASFVITKDSVFFSKNTDSHTEIRKEHKIPENTAGKIDSVQVEFSPNGLDYSLPLEQWVFKIDQDMLPDWWVAEYDEKRAREKLAEWKSTKLKTRVEQGNGNTGDRNSGDRNSGDLNSGDWNSGHRNSGDRNSGDWNSGDWNSGDLNSGDRNSGDLNSGYRNSGDRNSGDRNSGDLNSGDWNSGDRNSGDRNSGDRNSGDWNSGDWNSGDRNSGDRNSGDWNSGDYSSGVFCTEKNPKVIIFDKKSAWTFERWRKSKARGLLARMSPVVWVHESNMTQEERDAHPESHYTGGYLRQYDYKEACAKMWESFTDAEKKIVQSIPNFNAKKFEQITGIKVTAVKKTRTKKR